MAQKREPHKLIEHKRNHKGHREAPLVKSAWKKSGSHLSLKAFLRAAHAADPLGALPSLSAAAANWFINKRANPSNPPQGIGSTRKRKSKEGGKKGGGTSAAGIIAAAKK
jgi:hypothetical protein